MSERRTGQTRGCNHKTCFVIAKTTTCGMASRQRMGQNSDRSLFDALAVAVGRIFKAICFSKHGCKDVEDVRLGRQGNGGGRALLFPYVFLSQRGSPLPFTFVIDAKMHIVVNCHLGLCYVVGSCAMVVNVTFSHSQKRCSWETVHDYQV
jgi:hypothetical protein